ncbi:hypothetical protein NEMIN01_1545 [Nematocida minor]|uniref:uncharacterized protein n=1 Tax=Nematocida minor TaxID=1912983 RepID=UPI002220592B|nr:uncharacterized protein NEMIN01_1545 [Nematocida minor]KAI5191519.1 hypothetical protein NEMIN01_1545 [Nematocida minor]
MILGQALKKVAIGIAAMAYLHRAKGEIDSDALKGRAYWHNKVSCMKREVAIRRNFISEAGYFVQKEMPSDSLKANIDMGRKKLSKIEEHLEDSIKIAGHIVNNVLEMEYFNISVGFNQASIDALHNNLKGFFALALSQNYLLCNEIKKFDSYMLEVMGELSSRGAVKNSNKKIQELTLFKLAESNKPLAINILYHTFMLDKFSSNTNIKRVAYCIIKEITGYFLLSHLKDYENAVMDDIEKDEVDLLAVLDRNLHLLFKSLRINEDVMSIYFSLLKEDISEEEITQYRDITPGQIVKVIMVECAMHEDRIDYKRNNTFCNLGKIIVSIGKPSNNGSSCEDVKAAREKQDKILDALNLLWIENNEIYTESYKTCDIFIEKMKALRNEVDFFCKDNDINNADFESLQHLFMSARWMYKVNIVNPPMERIINDRRVLKMVYFDTSYIHPMHYIYQRCEDISQQSECMRYFAKVGPSIDEKQIPFMEEDSNGIATLRPYKISKLDNDLVQIDKMKDCIRATFLKKIKIIKGEDSKEYCDMANAFEKYLNKSQYVTEAEIMPEETSESRVNESNPLQDDRMEVDGDFEPVK